MHRRFTGYVVDKTTMMFFEDFEKAYRIKMVAVPQIIYGSSLSYVRSSINTGFANNTFQSYAWFLPASYTNLS